MVIPTTETTSSTAHLGDGGRIVDLIGALLHHHGNELLALAAGSIDRVVADERARVTLLGLAVGDALGEVVAIEQVGGGTRLVV